MLEFKTIQTLKPNTEILEVISLLSISCIKKEPTISDKPIIVCSINPNLNISKL